VALARAAAVLLALARPGVTVVDAGDGALREAVAPISIGVLAKAYGSGLMADGLETAVLDLEPLCHRWGIRTLGEFAALPADALSSRLGQAALGWQHLARGEDAAPLVPTLPPERFESSLELEWPIEGLEPLSFVLTRLLEPLAARLERRDRGAAVLALELRLVTREVYARQLQLPSPIREVRTLRTLLLLDLESNPPPAAIDCVTIRIDPTPGRVVQHTLFTRAQPTPEQLSTLVARLNALMGEDRVGTPAPVDSHRPGAFAMQRFALEHDHDRRRIRRGRREIDPDARVISALRRCRRPIPARVALEHARPVRLTTDRRGFAGGAVVTAVGPWRTSGHWWEEGAGPLQPWDRDEWDVAVAGGAVYRIFRDRTADAWFIDAIVD
jgi:protein ImuB